MRRKKKKEKEKTRITIDLTPAQYERLNRVEEAVGASSKADVVREALRIYEFFSRKTQEGYEFSMKRGDEPAERLLMFTT